MLNLSPMLRNHNIDVENSLCSNVTKYLTILLLSWYTHGTVKVMHRVDLSNPRVRTAVNVWVDSLTHWRGIGPDGLTAQDRSSVPGSTQSVVQDWFSQSTDVINTYPPTVLSAEGNDSQIVVRTLFSTTDPQTGHVIPLGILRSTLVLQTTGVGGTMDEGRRTSSDRTSDVGRWTLLNPLAESLASREATTVDMITYSHDEGTELNTYRASEATRFVRSIADRFDVAVPQDITMVLNNDRDAMCALLGLEYYAFPPSGLAYPDRNIILSSFDDPYYPHELTHIVLRPLEKNAHPIIREGVATWLGGSIRTGMTQLVSEYLAAREPQQVPTFLDLFTNVDLPQDDQYILGAAICATVAKRHGDKAVAELMMAEGTSDVLLKLKEYLGVDPSDKQASLVTLLRDIVSGAQAKPGR